MELDSRRNPNTARETKEGLLKEVSFESGPEEEVFSWQIRKGQHNRQRASTASAKAGDALSHSDLTQPQEVACQWLLCCKRRLEAFPIPQRTAQRKALYEDEDLFSWL